MTRATRWAGFRSVLCPVDFSEHSKHALQYAVAVARRGKTALKIIYVADPLLVAAASAALHDRRFVKRSARELEAFIEATFPTRTRARLRVSSRVSVGQPSDQIVKTASTGGTDLIVIGTHGLSSADRLFLGSTTLSVLQRASMPVLAIPRDGETPADAVPQSWPGPRILAAIELDGGLTNEADSAGRIAQWFGSSLLLAHVVTDVALPAWVSADLSVHQRIRIAHAQRQMDRLCAVAQRYVKADFHVACGNIADEIAALAATERAELLLIALHDRRRWFGAKRGSISSHILSHAVTPILAYPPQWRPR